MAAPPCAQIHHDDDGSFFAGPAGVMGINSDFTYSASPSVGGWAPNDIAAHISPLKPAGAPDAPMFEPR